MIQAEKDDSDECEALSKLNDNQVNEDWDERTAMERRELGEKSIKEGETRRRGRWN